MENTWFDKNFMEMYQNDVLPFIEKKINEGYFLKQEIASQRMERARNRARNNRTDRDQLLKNRILRAKQARARGEARAKDALAKQPISKPIYENWFEIFENKQSGKTRRKRDKFRGLKDFRKDFKLSTSMSLTGGKKEKDRIRKNIENKLNENISIQSRRYIYEQEEEIGQEPTEKTILAPEESQQPKEIATAADYVFTFEQLRPLRKKVKNVFENLSNISYKMLADTLGVFSISKDDKEFQLENALVLVSRVSSGASQQEIELMRNFDDERFFDFDEASFDMARKLLSYLGESCFQNIYHVDELSVVEDFPGFKRSCLVCGDNAFRVVVGKVYIKDSTDSPNYGIKMQNIINSLLPIAIPQDPEILDDDGLSIVLADVKKSMLNLSLFLVNDIDEDPTQDEAFMDYLDKNGLLDDEGYILNEAKLSSYNDMIEIAIQELSKKKSIIKDSAFFGTIVKELTRHYLVGVNAQDIRANATHLLTDNGLFIITEDMINYYAQMADVNIKVKSAIGSNKGRKKNGNKVPKALEKFRAIVEQVKEELKPSKNYKDRLINTAELIAESDASIYQAILNTFDFEYSLALNPGEKITPSQKKSAEFNVVKIGNKEFKIPISIDKGDMTTIFIKEDIDDACDYILSNTNISESAKRRIQNSKKTGNVPQDLVELISFVISQNRSKRKSTILEKLQGHEKHYSKKTSHHRSNRNKARRAAEKKWGKAAIKGKDVDHKDGNPMNNSPSNLRLRSPGDNRADNGHHKGEPYKKAKRGITNTYKGKDK